MLTTHAERPRELKWYHAGPMLYGDWGTSRFYVLGLALYYSQHASFWYVAAVCALVAAVGWAYTIICRCYPDGGGVYSAARHTSRTLAVVGALLLFADYLVTAALSAMDGMHYLQIKELVMSLGITHSPDAAETFVRVAAIAGIFLVGAINFIGPKKAGTFALVVAMGTFLLTLILVGGTLIPHAALSALAQGWHTVHRPEGSAGHLWHNLVNVVLALSGVEAIANMTGIMVPPVQRTAKKSIWPVLVEVVLFNLILAVAMNALPAKYFAHDSEGTQITLAEQEENLRTWEAAHPHWDKSPELSATHEQLDLTPDQKDAENRVLWVMAREFVGRPFAAICGIVFGLLLLSAVNTAVADMVSIQYVMARDTELPRGLMKLNPFGVPWRTLIAAVALPTAILLVTGDLDLLAGLYAIGVVGAIAINLGSCCSNLSMPLRWFERAGMGLLAAIMVAIELTLCIEKPSALAFAGSVLAIGLGLRFVGKTVLPARARALVALARGAAEFRAITGPSAIPAPAIEPGALGTPAEQLNMSKPKILVAARGSQKLIDFAATYAKRFDAVLMVMFVRQVNVIGMGAPPDLSIEDDPEARGVFERAADACRKAAVAMVPIYVVSPDVAYAILDHAATYSVDGVLMGVSREGALLKALRGDVLAAVAEDLPEDIPLLIHA
jgi:amino acid transporter/nucleotide-binding universal stress UspA family protein